MSFSLSSSQAKNEHEQISLSDESDLQISGKQQLSSMKKSQLSSSFSSQTSGLSSSKSQKFTSRQKQKFTIDKKIDELDDEDSSYIGSGQITKKPYYNKIHSSSNSSSDSVEKQMNDRSQKFKRELQSIKDMVNSSSDEKKPQLYASAKSGTLEWSVSSSQNDKSLYTRSQKANDKENSSISSSHQSTPAQQNGSRIEDRIKKLEKELQDTVRSKQSYQSLLDSSAKAMTLPKIPFHESSEKIQRKIDFKEQSSQKSDLESFDEETLTIQRQIERLKREVNEQSRKEDEIRSKLKSELRLSVEKEKNHKSKEIQKEKYKKESQMSFEVSKENQLIEIKNLERTLIEEIQKLKNDNIDLRNIIMNHTVQNKQIPSISPPKPQTELKKLVQSNEFYKLEKQIQLLKQVERIRDKLKHSISRKISQEKYKINLKKNLIKEQANVKKKPQKKKDRRAQLIYFLKGFQLTY